MIQSETPGGARPASEGQSVDLRIVANIDRKLRVEEKQPNGGRLRLAKCELPQFAGESLRGGGVRGTCFDDEGGTLMRTDPKTD